MPSSTYDSILNAIAAMVDGLGLTDWNGNAVPVVVRKLPKREEDVDPTPFIVVCPGPEPEKIERKVFGGFFAWYPSQVVAIAGGNADFTTNLDYYLAWREPIRQTLQIPTLPGVPGVFDARIAPDQPIDRAMIAQNYDLTLLRVSHRVYEALV